MTRPAERAERTGRAAYWTMLGGSSPKCRPRDRATAFAFLAKIESAIERGGWTRNEWRNLHQLHERWSNRAHGRDPRFEEVGTAPGRLERDKEAWIRKRKRIFKTAEWRRVARPLQLVNQHDPRTRLDPATIRGRFYKRRRDERQDL